MKPRTAFAISTFCTALALSFGASAAPETATNQQPANAATTTPTTPAQGTPRHSHMTEKLGTPAERAVSGRPEAKAEERGASPVKRHNHQRDMK